MRLLTITYVFFFSMSLAVQTQAIDGDEQAASQPLPEAVVASVEEVLVIGEQPGPGLWKVSKGDHVLWIMGTLKPIPKKMTWRSKQVEAVLAASQEYITPPSVGVRISTANKFMLLPSLIGIRNNPDGKKLQEVVPAELYSRWLVLKKKYIGRNNSIENWRPIFAAHKLYEQAVDKSGLTESTNIMDVLREIAKENKVMKAGPGTTTEIAKPREVVKKFKQMPIDDLACFAKVIERLETDLDEMRARANAWAVGDVDALRKLPEADHDQICKAAVFNAALAEEHGLQDIPQQKQRHWLAEAESSLAKHESTFSILPIIELLKPNGYLAVLREKGYVVEEP
ncbi:MAG: TraB/GumN family protein [Pseudomonadota bacterium]